jgi:hypothetical protein
MIVLAIFLLIGAIVMVVGAANIILRWVLPAEAIAGLGAAVDRTVKAGTRLCALLIFGAIVWAIWAANSSTPSDTANSVPTAQALGREAVTHPLPDSVKCAAPDMLQQTIDGLNATSGRPDIRLTSLSEPQVVSRSSSELFCTAKGVFTDLRMRVVEYRFFMNGDQVKVEISAKEGKVAPVSDAPEVILAPPAAIPAEPKNWMRVDAADLALSPEKYVDRDIQVLNARCYFAGNDDYRCTLENSSPAIVVFTKEIFDPTGDIEEPGYLVDSSTHYI